MRLNDLIGDKLLGLSISLSGGFSSDTAAVTNRENVLAGLSREPFAVPFISPKVFALCQEDDGECDRAVSPGTCSEFCPSFSCPPVQ